MLSITLIKNVTTTSKGDRYWKAQHYTILTEIVDETTQACFLYLHKKLSNVQPTSKKGKFLSFPLHHSIFFQIYTKNPTQLNVHLIINYIRKDYEKYKNNVMKNKKIRRSHDFHLQKQISKFFFVFLA
jgi:hypothetical protein